MTTEPPTPRRGRVRRRILWTVVASTALGAGLRFYGIGRESYWLDEMISIIVARGGLDLVRSEAAIGREPLYYSLLVAWRGWFGESEVAIRALSAIAGIAAIPVLYSVVSRIAGRRAGVVAAFLLAVLPTQIYYAQEARAYAWLVLLGLGSQAFYERLWRSPRSGDWLGYAALTTAMLYTHATGVFLLAAQNLLWGLCHRGSGRSGVWLLCQMLLAVASLPILGEDATGIATGTHGVQAWIGEVSLHQLAITLHWLLFPSVAIMSRPHLLALSGLLAAIWLAVGFSPGRPARRRLGRMRRNALVKFTVLTVVPILGPFCLALVFGNVFIFRYTLLATPGLCGLAALLLVSLHPRIPDTASVAAVALVIGLLLPTALVLRLKEPWREGVGFVESSARAGDALISRPSRFAATTALIEYYARSGLPICTVVGDARIDCPSSIGSDAPPFARYWCFYRGAFSNAERERLRLERLLSRPVRNLQRWNFRDLGLALLEVETPPPAAVAAPPVDR